LPPEYEAVTGADLSAESSQSVANTLGFFRTFMLVFAFVALFVGAFIVYNTYSIVIAERTRELALIRALGASGLAVLGSVLIEAIITGLVASGIGVVVGVLIALGCGGCSTRWISRCLPATLPSYPARCGSPSSGGPRSPCSPQSCRPCEPHASRRSRR
jgi:putative ABC transport system permease protein